MKVLTRSLVALPLLAIAIGAGAPMYAGTIVEGQVSQGPSGSVSSRIYNRGAQSGSPVSDTLTYNITCSTCIGYAMTASGAATVNDGSLVS